MKEENIVTVQPITGGDSMDKDSVRAMLAHLLKCVDEEGAIDGIFIVSISKPMESEIQHAAGEKMVGRGFVNFKLDIAESMADMVYTTLERQLMPAAVVQMAKKGVVLVPVADAAAGTDEEQLKH